MSAWIPILTGLLAFVGAIAGHFVAFNLNAAAKRRDVRRAQIERFAEFISEDQTSMDKYRQQALYGKIDYFQTETAPADSAFAIYMLYFSTELTNTMSPFITARQEYKTAMGQGFGRRLSAATATMQPLSSTVLPKADTDSIMAKYPPYYQAILDNLGAASKIAQETIPEKSQMATWCANRWARPQRP